MPKFMSSHTVPASALTREQINQIAQAAQNDPIAAVSKFSQPVRPQVTKRKKSYVKGRRWVS
jgi:hypothetical protein